VAETIAKAADFRVEHILERMCCPYLILHGAHDVFDVDAAERVYKHARDCGVDVTLRMLDAEDTGAEHCQQDNSPLGMAVIGDWLSDRFGIDQHTVLGHHVGEGSSPRPATSGALRYWPASRPY